MDENAAETLENLQVSLKNQGIMLGICEVKGHFRRVLMTTHLPGRVGFVIHPSVAVAVRELANGSPKKAEKESTKKAETVNEQNSDS